MSKVVEMRNEYRQQQKREVRIDKNHKQIRINNKYRQTKANDKYRI